MTPYEKMPTSLKKLRLTAADYTQLNKLQWVVTEKIHGANFSFIYDQRQLRFAKRKAFLAWEDDFFGFQDVVQKIENAVMNLFEALSRDIEAQHFIIYGELFGGSYPHPGVEPNEKVQAIQTGIYYSPTIEFCAFDIAVVENNTKGKYYLDYTDAKAYFESHNLLYAKVLHEGNLNEVLAFDINIHSTLPKTWNLPELEENLIEGIVIKPLAHSTCKLSQRPIIKIKNPEFEETKKFHQAKKWSYIPKAVSQAQELDFLVEAVKTYITSNRLQSAISKIGAWRANDLERQTAIEAEFLGDVWTDFNEDNDDILEELNSQQKDWIKQRIRAALQSKV
ncbi:MAG: RNA ligase family protein [Chitinophagales bacterium]